MEDVKKGGIRLYPNPTIGVFHVSGLQGGETITVIDYSGRVLLTRKASGETETVRTENLPQGLYIVRVTSEKAVKVLTLVKL